MATEENTESGQNCVYAGQNVSRKVNDRRLSFLTVCSCHVTYAFQSQSTLYSCLNVKGLLARNKREI